MRASIAIVAACAATLLAAGTGTARAGTYGFTYSGTATNPGGFDYAASGSGSFTLDTAAGTAGLADVTAFSLTLQVTDLGQPSGSNTDTISYSLSDPYNGGASDLTSFVATLGGGGALTSLALETDYGFDSATGNYGGWYTVDEAFDIADLLDGDTFDFDVGELTSGSIALVDSQPVPEPLGAATLAAGLLALGWVRRRRA